MIEEWTFRWTTTGPRSGGPSCVSPTAWARARQIAWLPPEAPFSRNQLRFAPQASAASCCARWNGVGSGPTSIPSIPPGTSCRIAASPSASVSSGSAAVPLCPGMCSRAGPAGDIGGESVEIGSFSLIAGHRAECRCET